MGWRSSVARRYAPSKWSGAAAKAAIPGAEMAVGARSGATVLGATRAQAEMAAGARSGATVLAATRV